VLVNSTVMVNSNQTIFESLTIGDYGIPCSWIFANSTSAPLFYAESDCYLFQTDSKSLNLVFDGSFLKDALFPNQNITFLLNTLVGAIELHTHSLSNPLVVQNPKNPPTPMAVVAMPSIISSCQDLVMDFSSTTGSAGRDWKSITFKSNSSSLATVLNSQSGYLKSRSSSLAFYKLNLF
jgi:hypothetical protein